MPGSRYTGTDHTQKLVRALDAFHRALTYRWRQAVAEAIIIDSGDFPVAIGQPEPAGRRGSLWSFSTVPARFHIEAVGRSCGYLMWVWTGQNGPLSAVRCDGWTGGHAYAAGAQEDAGVPEYIDCGVGSILAQVEDWAWEERQQVFSRIPLFDGLDLAALKETHDALLELGGQLGLEAGGGSEQGVLGPFTGTPAAERPIPNDVRRVSSQHGPGAALGNWWVGWTGLEASWARAGFFASVMPSMNNQAGIAGSLANLYAYRAAIIEKGRNDALYWVQWATESLDQTKLEVTDYTRGWKAVQGFGMGTTVVAALAFAPMPYTLALSDVDDSRQFAENAPNIFVLCEYEPAAVVDDEDVVIPDDHVLLRARMSLFREWGSGIGPGLAYTFAAKEIPLASRDVDDWLGVGSLLPRLRDRGVWREGCGPEATPCAEGEEPTIQTHEWYTSARGRVGDNDLITSWPAGRALSWARPRAAGRRPVGATRAGTPSPICGSSWPGTRAGPRNRCRPSADIERYLRYLQGVRRFQPSTVVLIPLPPAVARFMPAPG